MNKTDLILEHIGEPWHGLLYLVVAVVLAWWAWRGYGPAAPGIAGWLARVCRCAAVAVLVALIAAPALRTTDTKVLPGRLLVAVDRSASMAKADGPGGQPRIALAGPLAQALGRVAGDRQVTIDWRAIGGLDGTLAPADLIAGTVAATGAISPLGDELERLVLATRPDGLVVVSDGRVTSGSALAALAPAWRATDLRVAVLACGGDAVEPELLIDDVVMNREVAKGEREPVVVRFSHRALPDGPITVRITPQGGMPEKAQVVPGAGDHAAMRQAEARLETVFIQEGPTVLDVVVEGPGGRKTSQSVPVTVRERRLAVLLLENRPRFEVRYLREAFKRDRTVTLHAYLAEGRWRRWGTGSAAEAGPDRLPLTAVDLKGYDLVILGDCGPESFTDEQQQALVQAVRRDGLGLVWIAGEQGLTAGFVGKPLGELLPVELPDATAIARGYLTGEPRRAGRTPAATQLGLLEAGEVDWPALPALLGAAPVTAVKPGAEVLVVDQGDRPLVVSRAYGAGRSLFLAVDDTWRWRRNVGDRYLHRFHSQLFRYAASGRRLGRQEWRLFASPRRAVAGETVTLSLVPNGPLPDQAPEGVNVRLARTGDAAGTGERVVRLVREGAGFTARLPAPVAGEWALSVAGGLDPRAVEGDHLLVAAPADERRDPRSDRPGLEAFARAVGGTIATDPAKLVESLPDLRHTETVVTLRGLWDSAWALALLVFLLAVDWSVRRRNRLP